MNNQEIGLILSKVGEKFLQYVLNCNEPILQLRNDENYQFNPIQLHVLNELCRLITESEVTVSQNPNFTIKHFLFKYGNVFNEMRRSCGGNIIHKNDSNSLLNYLLKKGTEYYPSLLIIDEIKWFNSDQTGIQNYPFIFPQDANIVAKLLFEDSDLNRLFSEDQEYVSLQAHVNYKLNNDISVFCWSWQFTSSFILRSFQNCCYRVKYNLTNLLDDIENQYIRLKAIANNEEIEVSYFCGVYGLRLEGIEEYNLSDNIIIRNINEVNNPCIQHTISISSSDVYSKVITGCTLEYRVTTAHFNTNIIVDNQDSKESDKVEDIFNQANHILEDLVNKIAISTVISTRALPAPFKSTFIDQDAPLSMHHPRIIPNNSAGMGVSILDMEALNKIKNWFVKLGSIDLSYISLALRRLLASLYNRIDPIDSILDAFIAWESMFNSPISTTKSVVNSIAEILKRSDTKVSKTVLINLYDFRSSIVHGNPLKHDLLNCKNPLQKIESIKTQVIEIAIAVLEELIQDKVLLYLSPQERVVSLLAPTIVYCENCQTKKYNFSSSQ
ncbi:MAG: hypothetical protein IPM69_10990 [Ignavibacteria bacterium]|nr:hypothetical protein [Ignavibacteria bacterium]